MSLANFSLPFGILAPPTHTAWGVTTSPLHSVHQLATNTDNLLYSPVAHQQQPDDEVPPPPGAEFYKNNPYGPPQLHQQHQQHQQPQQQQQFQYNNNNNNRRKGGNTYLPPPAQTGAYNHHQQQQQQQPPQQISFINSQQQLSNNDNNNNNNRNNNQELIYNTQTTAAAAAAAARENTLTTTSSRTYGEGSYSRFPGEQHTQQQQQHTQQQQQTQQHQFFNSYSATQTTTSFNTQQTVSHQQKSPLSPATPPKEQQQQSQPPIQSNLNKLETPDVAPVNKNDPFPERPPGFTRVQAGQGSRTQVHAVLDYDVEDDEEEEEVEEGADYYDEHDPRLLPNKHGSKKSSSMPVTPIQGPIFLKNGTVPVVPLFSYPTINNGSFIQIPIWWTALSVALGLDVRGDIIKGVPCIKRYHQLFCPTAGNSYPIDKIERFIDDNKALMRRMYGDFEMNMDVGEAGAGKGPQSKQRRRRFIDEPDIFIPPGVFPSAIISPDDDDHHRVEEGESYFGKLRDKRQASKRGSGKASSFGRPTTPGGPGNSPGNAGASTGRLDACESKVEIVTPYWASNSAGKIRAIVNTQHFEQAIHQEICSKTLTPRCKGDCGCEQKYKWHRLLAYDPDNDCKGIFMDWFLFPSCCVCRCNP